MSWPLQITSRTRDFVTDLVPSDVTDFIAQSRERLHDFAALDVMPMMKIPAANTRWLWTRLLARSRNLLIAYSL